MRESEQVSIVTCGLCPFASSEKSSDLAGKSFVLKWEWFSNNSS